MVIYIGTNAAGNTYIYGVQVEVTHSLLYIGLPVATV